ncbi:hypothetical protein FOMPIDRAFT_1045310 [Fomitopsis schrenkii]|uniref:Uncharacterized protein n=1 Tax=Fomitopsis schrenkii TaxID=2126942 RepID=S8EJF3_FOMSC|nr:hypothetical protein FOMPIDRAFT_1045310 [Fomitopsis schrenkii]
MSIANFRRQWVDENLSDRMLEGPSRLSKYLQGGDRRMVAGATSQLAPMLAKAATLRELSHRANTFNQAFDLTFICVLLR